MHPDEFRTPVGMEPAGAAADFGRAQGLPVRRRSPDGWSRVGTSCCSRNIAFWHRELSLHRMIRRARWIVDQDVSRNRQRSQASRAAFSKRANPNAESDQGRDCRRLQAGADYPARCDPRRSRGPLTEQQRELATCYLPLARALARRMRDQSPRAGADEYESAAFLALVEAAQSFDPARNINFATFAQFRIRGALRDFRRELISGGGRRGADSWRRVRQLGDESEAEGWLVGLRVDAPVGAEIEALDSVESWIRRLPRRHATAFRHIYLEGKTQEEAAALVGCSKSFLSRIHREAVSWLQEALGEIQDRASGLSEE